MVAKSETLWASRVSLNVSAGLRTKIATAAKIAIMAITIKSSSNVKPFLGDIELLLVIYLFYKKLNKIQN